ncbi:hypothetical protein RUND412_005506 [Rhizina undulata]
MQNPIENDKLWLENLIQTSYELMARIASGELTVIPGGQYSAHACIVDLKETSCVNTTLPWPEYALPTDWMVYVDRWGKLGDIATSGNVEGSSGEDEEIFSGDEDVRSVCDLLRDSYYVETRGVGIGKEELAVIEKGHCEKDFNIQTMISDLVEGRDIMTLGSVASEMDEHRIRLLVPPEYITAEASQIAQLNTAGLTLCLLNRLRTR